MEQRVLEQVLAQCRRVASQLSETLELTHQLGEATARNDQAVVQLLLGLREETIGALLQSKKSIQQQLAALPQEHAQRLAQLLNGAPVQTQQEQALAQQVAYNNTLLWQVREQDRALSEKLLHEKSIYHGGNKMVESPKSLSAW